MTEPSSVEALLVKLRESRLTSDERRDNLDALRTSLDPLITGIFTSPRQDSDILLIRAAIQEGPNDVRRIVLQGVTSRIETHRPATNEEDARSTVGELIDTIEAALRSILKLQSPQSTSRLAPFRSAVDVLSLPISALRAAAAALKALHALLQFLPKQDNPTSRHPNSAARSLSGLLDVLLPCLSSGLQLAKTGNGVSQSRSRTSFQAGAFSWSEPHRSAHPTANKASQVGSSSAANCSAPLPNSSAQIYPDCSSSGETDRKSDKSESERSDFSVASAVSISSRTRKDESRQLEATAKLIRQNALHCLIELNRHESRALISRWGDLLPGQPAALTASKHADTPALPVSRFSASSSSHASFSLGTLITQDPSTSVRIAAMHALESILSRGALQLSMAEERTQRALAFTSLASQMAGWILNIRSYLVVALQRAATAPRTLTGGAAAGYPSSLCMTLLQLTRTFATSTAKAKLVTSNTAALSPVVLPFASHSDPDIQALAKRLLSALTAHTRTPPALTKSRKASTTTTTALLPSPDSLHIGDEASNTSNISSQRPMVEYAARLGEGAELTRELCDQVLSSFEAASEPTAQLLLVWTVLVKSLADSPASLLSPAASQRLLKVWIGLSSQEHQPPDQQSTILATLPDLCKALSRSSADDPNTVSTILRYVQECCRDSDDVVRGAAIRVLGLLIVPQNHSGSVRDDAHQEQVSRILDGVLWGGIDQAGRGALHDKSSLVRQRASWTFSNAMEARLRAGSSVDELSWLRLARYCLEAGKDIEGVAVSACRAAGSLLAMLPPTASAEACSVGNDLLEQLCRVLGSTSKPPKSRWNAASALDRALTSDVVMLRILLASASSEKMMDRIVELLCSNLNAKVFKIRVSAANALLSVCLGADKAQSLSSSSNSSRLEMIGEHRRQNIHGLASARLAELGEPPQSKEHVLYLDELQHLLTRLIASCSPLASS